MRVAYFAYRYPTLSQTFIQREIAAVARHGVEIQVNALRASPLPEGYQNSERVSLRQFSLWKLGMLLWRLPQELGRAPELVGEAIEILIRTPWRSWENLWINLLGAAVAVIEAERFRREPVDHFHGVWATGAATAAAVLGRLCGKPFSMGGHAFDIYRFGGDAWLDLKLARAKFVHTTTQANVRFLTGRVSLARVVLSRRGIASLPELKKSAVGSQKFKILSVARLVEKKGISFQIEAAAVLKKDGFLFDHRIVGEGPLLQKLKEQISRFGLEDSVFLMGALPHSEVERLYEEADLFLHTGLIDAEGDRDGLPNVIPEAFARGIAVVSSPTPGADEAVVHGVTGWVVDPRDSSALATAIQQLAGQPGLRESLGRAGRAWVDENFLSEKNAAILVQEFKRPSA